MKKVTPERLIRFVGEREGMRLRTLIRRRPFSAHTSGDGLEYVPSTNKPRLHEMKWLAGVCKEFNRSGSFRPSNYIHLTMNASYTLALIDKYLKAP
jgi:hypothetical protein